LHTQSQMVASSRCKLHVARCPLPCGQLWHHRWSCCIACTRSWRLMFAASDICFALAFSILLSHSHLCWHLLTGFIGHIFVAVWFKRFFAFKWTTDFTDCTLPSQLHPQVEVFVFGRITGFSTEMKNCTVRSCKQIH